MERKIILSSDSTCDLTKELRDRYNVEIYPYHIILEDKDYLDNVTITPKDVYDAYFDRKVLPKTAAINSYDYEQYFRQWTDKGIDVIHFTLGGALTASYKNCLEAARRIGEHVYVIDSFNLSTGIGLLVIKAAEMIAEGLETEEIKERIERLRGKVHTSFILDTLKFMHAGGRCSGVVALSAGVLNLKPCIVVDNTSGSMSVGKKYRGNLKKVLKHYVEDTLEQYPALDLSRIFITYSSLEDMSYVETVRKAIEKHADFNEIHVTVASTTIACHCGPNCLGILFMTI
jgi:DegV family protein with EDD domain